MIPELARAGEILCREFLANHHQHPASSFSSTDINSASTLHLSESPSNEHLLFRFDSFWQGWILLCAIASPPSIRPLLPADRLSTNPVRRTWSAAEVKCSNALERLAPEHCRTFAGRRTLRGLHCVLAEPVWQAPIRVSSVRRCAFCEIAIAVIGLPLRAPIKINRLARNGSRSADH